MEKKVKYLIAIAAVMIVIAAVGGYHWYTVTLPPPRPGVLLEELFPRADRDAPDWVIKKFDIPEGFIFPNDWVRKQDWEAIKKKFAGTTITMMCEGPDIVVPLMWKSKFEALSGIKVEVFGIPHAVHYEKLMAEFSAATGRYDVVEFFNDWGRAYLPYLEDLRPYAEKYGVNITSFHPAFMMGSIIDDAVIGLPTDADARMFHYIGDLYKEAGLDPNRPPETWEEVIEYCKKLEPVCKPKGIYPYAIMGGARSFWTYWMWYEIFLSYGGRLFKPGTWEPTLNTSAGVKAIEIFAELYKYSDPASINWFYDENREAWLGGKVAQVAQWACVGRQAYDPELSAIAGKDLRHVPTPKGTEFAPTGIFTTAVLAIPKTSDAKEAAFLWIAFQTSQETEFINSITGTGVEVGHWEVIKHPVTQRGQPSFVPQVKSMPYYWNNIIIPESFLLEEAAGKYIYDAMLGKITPKEALDKANAEWYAILEGAGYYKPGTPPPPPLSVREWCEKYGWPLPP